MLRLKEITVEKFRERDRLRYKYLRHKHRCPCGYMLPLKQKDLLCETCKVARMVALSTSAKPAQ